MHKREFVSAVLIAGLKAIVNHSTVSFVKVKHAINPALIPKRALNLVLLNRRL